MSDLDRIKLGKTWGNTLLKSDVSGQILGQVSKQVGQSKCDKIV